jgi:hypothetical protein
LHTGSSIYCLAEAVNFKLKVLKIFRRLAFPVISEPATAKAMAGLLAVCRSFGAEEKAENFMQREAVAHPLGFRFCGMTAIIMEYILLSTLKTYEKTGLTPAPFWSNNMKI